MIHTKILKFPEFRELPKTNCADVKENIENWMRRNKSEMLEAFCIIDLSKTTGYRFITSSDLEETIVTEQVISKIPFKITWVRRVHTSDHYCPLYFTERDLTAILEYKNFKFEFKSDNNIKTWVKLIKSKQQ